MSYEIMQLHANVWLGVYRPMSIIGLVHEINYIMQDNKNQYKVYTLLEFNIRMNDTNR